MESRTIVECFRSVSLMEYLKPIVQIDALEKVGQLRQLVFLNDRPDSLSKGVFLDQGRVSFRAAGGGGARWVGYLRMSAV